MLAARDSRASLVQRDRLAAEATKDNPVSKVLLVLLVTPALSVSSAGQDLPDHKVHVAFQVTREKRDCLVSLDLQDCRDSRDLWVAQVKQEVVGTLVQPVLLVALVRLALRVRLDRLDRVDSLDQMEQLDLPDP